MWPQYILRVLAGPQHARAHGNAHGHVALSAPSFVGLSSPVSKTNACACTFSRALHPRRLLACLPWLACLLSRADGASLHCALNHPRRLKEVLQTGGTNPNAKDEDGDRTPLHWAAARGHLRCIHLLLEAGADPSVVDANGQTPVQVAEAVEQPLAHDLLVHGPPKPDPRSMHSGLFSLSLHSALNQPTELRKILESGYEWRIQKGEPIKCKLDPNLADSDGDRTPLHWAAARGYIECIKLLLQYGASPGSTDCNGKTPAALAFECNQHATQSLLLNYKPPSVREGMHSINDPVAIDQLDLVA